MSHSVDLSFNLLGGVIVFSLNGSFFPQFKLCNAATDFFKLLNRITQRLGRIIVFISYGTFLRSVELPNVLYNV
jgi:hypothetical protein